jgi:hypothetical protein
LWVFVVTGWEEGLGRRTAGRVDDGTSEGFRKLCASNCRVFGARVGFQNASKQCFRYCNEYCELGELRGVLWVMSVTC